MLLTPGGCRIFCSCEDIPGPQIQIDGKGSCGC
jgi:hypothetical protein